MIKDVFKLSILEQPGSTAVDVLLYGFIGPDWYREDEKQNTDEGVATALDSLAKKYARINLRINSPGGSLMHGNAIISAIQRCTAELHVYNDGVCASMAADIFMACPNRHMAKTSMMMVHAPSCYAYGNAFDMRECADMLDAFAGTAILVMSECCGMATEEVESKFYDGKDHWLSHKQCVEMGIVNLTDEYEAAAPPDGVEKMAFPDLLAMFQQKENQGQQRPANWLQKLSAAIWSGPKKTALPEATNTIVLTQKEDDMSIEAIKAAIEAGTIKAEDLAGLLPEKNATLPAAPVVEETDFQKLQNQVTALTAKIDKMSAAPGAGKTLGAFPDTDVDKDGAGDPLKTLNDELYSSRSNSQRFVAQ